MVVRIISPSDKSARVNGSFAREVTKLGKTLHGVWMGYATLKAGASYASLDILIPAQQRGVIDTPSLIIEANSRIVSVSIRPRTVLTLGTATGKLKFASSLAAATAALYVETAAAVGGVLAVTVPAYTPVTVPPTTPIPPAVETLNITSVVVGGADTTYRIYATDGGVGAAAVASSMSSPVDTYIDVEIGFSLFAPFPTILEVGKAAPPVR